MAALYKEQLGQIIRQRRLDLDLTQRQLADRIPIQEPQTVSRWERGVNSPTDLEAIAAALETTAGEMLAQLSPVAQADRSRRAHDERTQLDRIEQRLEELADLQADVTKLREALAGLATDSLRHTRELQAHLDTDHRKESTADDAR